MKNKQLVVDPGYKSRSASKFVLRYQSEELIARLHDAAKENHRSVNSEINARLMASFNNEGLVQGELIESSFKGTPLAEGMLVNAQIGNGNTVGVIRDFAFENGEVVVRIFALIEQRLLPTLIPIGNITPLIGG